MEGGRSGRMDRKGGRICIPERQKCKPRQRLKEIIHIVRRCQRIPVPARETDLQSTVLQRPKGSTDVERHLRKWQRHWTLWMSIRPQCQSAFDDANRPHGSIGT